MKTRLFMAMERRRGWILGFLLALTIAASLWVARQDTPVPDPAAGLGREAPTGQALEGKDVQRSALATHLVPLLGQERLSGQAERALFGSRTWQGDSPPAPQPEAPARAARLPSFDYGYMGKMLVPGKPTRVFLTRGDQPLTVETGASVDAEFRLEEISETDLVVAHIPSGRRLTLPLASLAHGESVPGTAATSRPQRSNEPATARLPDGAVVAQNDHESPDAGQVRRVDPPVRTPTAPEPKLPPGMIETPGAAAGTMTLQPSDLKNGGMVITEPPEGDPMLIMSPGGTQPPLDDSMAPAGAKPAAK